VPYTPEVWATVATGLGPKDHGISTAGTSEWDNPALEFASRFTGHLSEGTRGTLGKVVRSRTGERARIGETDRESMFDADDAVVHNWPGVHDGGPAPAGLGPDERRLRGNGAKRVRVRAVRPVRGQFGWAREMLNHPVSIAGVHVHALDAAGHAYAADEDALRRAYERIGSFVDEVVDALGPDDELLLLSDHGMRTAFYPPDAGEDPASHSWRAYASATGDSRPESVYDVREWVESRAATATATADGADDGIEMPTERLRELGYLE